MFIAKLGIIILASQSVLTAMFFAICKMFGVKPEKHDIIHIDGKDIRVSIWVSVDKYQSQWYG